MKHVIKLGNKYYTDSEHWYKNEAPLCFAKMFETKEEAEAFAEKNEIQGEVYSLPKRKYVVTDPCYFLTDEEWNACCDKLAEPSEFYKAIKEVLEKITGGEAWVSETGYGDWSNCIFGENVFLDDFCADSGTVCVCELTEELEARRKHHAGIAAVFLTDEEISVEIDKSNKRWTVLRITDSAGNQWRTGN